MSTGTAIIQEALQEIGAHSVASPAGPESIETGRKKLNSMIQRWESELIIMGCVPLSAPGQELSEPSDARDAIVQNLALRLVPNFNNGRAVNITDLKEQAKDGLRYLERNYKTHTIPKRVPSATLPKGEGNRHVLDGERYFDNNDTLTDVLS